jgi:hypothetical protein
MTDGDQSARFAAPAGFGKIAKRDFQNAAIVRTAGEYKVEVPPRQVAMFVFAK